MKNPKNKNDGNENRSRGHDDDVMTIGKFQYYFESIKDLIISSGKSIETNLGGRMDRIEGRMDRLHSNIETLQVAVTEHSKQIKAVDKKVDCLDKKVDSVRTELKEDIARVEGNMVQMEKRLSDKIDSVVVTRIDDHENRIIKLETTSLHSTP